jgi:hypothetical protein
MKSQSSWVKTAPNAKLKGGRRWGRGKGQPIPLMDGYGKAWKSVLELYMRWRSFGKTWRRVQEWLHEKEKMSKLCPRKNHPGKKPYRKPTQVGKCGMH